MSSVEVPGLWVAGSKGNRLVPAHTQDHTGRQALWVVYTGWAGLLYVSLYVCPLGASGTSLRESTYIL